MTTTSTRELGYLQAINEGLMQEMERDESVIIMGQEVVGAAGRAHLGFPGPGSQLLRGTLGWHTGLKDQIGMQRLLDTPLSEAAVVGTAIGAASTGLRPVAEVMYIDFTAVCMDQIINNAAKMRYMYGGQVTVPLTLLVRIGATGGMGAQHSGAYYSLFSHIPGLKGVVPSDPYTAKGLMVAAIRDDDPVVFFEHKALYSLSSAVPEELYELPLGKARTVREGSDITLVGVSRMTHVCIEAADELARTGTSAEVIDLMSVSPIDYDHVLDSVRRTRRLVVVDEDNPVCSIAATICARVAEEAFDVLEAPASQVTAPHTPVPYSKVLEGYYLPDKDRVVQTARELLDR
jgi:pyruvate/2-oxoglutarate/acetoin dehydrogenase E1 component